MWTSMNVINPFGFPELVPVPLVIQGCSYWAVLVMSLDAKVQRLNLNPAVTTRDLQLSRTELLLNNLYPRPKNRSLCHHNSSPNSAH